MAIVVIWENCDCWNMGHFDCRDMGHCDCRNMGHCDCRDMGHCVMLSLDGSEGRQSVWRGTYNQPHIHMIHVCC